MTDRTGNEYVDAFLEEYDIRCEGGRGTPPESAARLRAMRPAMRSLCFDDPDTAEQTMLEILERMFP